MPNKQPSPNGKKPIFDGLEEVDPADIDFDEPSTLEVIDKKQGFGFWMALLWCIVFLIATQIVPLVAIVVCLGVYLGANGTVVQPDDLANSPLMKQVIQIAVPVIEFCSISFALILLEFRVGREWMRKIGLRLPSVEHVLIVCAALPALLLLMNGVAYEAIRKVVPGFDKFGVQGMEEFMKETQSWPWWLAVLAIGLGPAIGEELFCRGFLGQGLAGRYRTWVAALLASFFFGLIHLDPPHAIWAMLMGIVLHFSYLMTRSILTPMLIHFFNNSIAVLSISDNVDVPFAKSLEAAFDFRPWLMSATAAFVLLSAGAALYNSRVRFWTSDGLEAPKAPYPHVEYPPAGSRYDVHPGPVSPLHMLAMIVSVAAFTAAWFGL